VLLGAQERGLASYWRTPAVLRTAAGRAALDVPGDVRLIGLLHLGPRRQEQPAPERAPLQDVVSWLD
jgi:nitroreductase